MGMYIFNKENFNKAATGTIKSRVKNYLDVVEGLEVKFNESEYGYLDFKQNGEEFEIYPVYKEWCKEVKND